MRIYRIQHGPKRKYWLVIVVIVLATPFLFNINNKVFLGGNISLSKKLPEKVLVKSSNAVKVERKTFGLSEKGRAIEGYEIGQGKDVIFLFASIHGNEMGTADLLNRLVSEIEMNPLIVSTSKKLIIIPIVNPDGYYDRTDKLNANGVNLNLNFATSGWRQYGSEGTYAGKEPFSEKESRIIRQVVEDYKPNLLISFHSFGSLVTPETNHFSSMELARWYAGETGYTYFDDGSWDYSGTATKWFVETTGKPAITVELSSNDSSDWNINQKALTELVSKALF